MAVHISPMLGLVYATELNVTDTEEEVVSTVNRVPDSTTKSSGAKGGADGGKNGGCRGGGSEGGGGNEGGGRTGGGLGGDNKGGEEGDPIQSEY